MLCKKAYNNPNKFQDKRINKQNNDTSLDYFKIKIYLFIYLLFFL